MSIQEDDIAYVPSIGARRAHEVPLVVATDWSLKGYGALVDDPKNFPVEIVRWPQQGWRPIDANSGDQGGTTQGVFEFAWKGDTLWARNNAVGSNYHFGWSTWPDEAKADGPTRPRSRALLWRANYHPDGGQLVYPMQGESFVVPMALPGDDVTPEKFVNFYCDGRQGLYIHPNVWHGPFVPHADQASLFDRQGKVHARVSVDFPKEFGCYLQVSLAKP